MRYFIIILVVLLVSNGYSQPPCGSNPAAGNSCATATPICELNGYCGNTSASYTVNTWSNSCGFLGLSDCGLSGEFCGSIENNSFLSFVASSSSISFDVWVYNSSYGDGIQIMIFSANNCSGSVNSYYCDQISPSSTSQTVSASGLTPGNTYYLMIDGFAGDVCDYTFAANSGVSIPVDITPATSSICSGQSVTLTASGGNGTYTWNSSPQLSGTTGATVTATPPSTPGTYTYTVNSATGNPLCPSSTTATATVTVTSCGGCTVTAGNSGDVCEGTAAFDLTASNVAGATYSWVGPNGFTSSLQNPSGVAVPATAGSYTYTVTATVAGVPCTSTTTLVVNPIPTINAPSTGLCVGGTVTLTGSGTPDATTPWSSSNTAVATVSTSGVVSAVGQGSVVITYTNSGGCSATQTITVVSNPTASIAGSTAVCSGSGTSITFTGTPGATVTYQVNGGTNQTIVLDASGNGTLNTGALTTSTTYSLISVQISPPGGCSATVNGSATVSITSPPTMNALSNLTACNGDIMNVPVFGSTPSGATFDWTNNNTAIGLPASGTGDIGSFTASSGAATVSVTPTLNGCIGTTANFTITVSAIPVADAGPDIQFCEGSTNGITIGNGAVSGMTYSWSPATYLSDATIANPQVTGAPSGTYTYTLTISNANGCSSTDAVDVVVVPSPQIAFQSDIQSGCNPQTITFTNNTLGSVNCIWDIELYGQQNGCGSITQVFNQAGTFDVGLTVTNSDGCSSSLTQQDMITIYPQPVAGFDVSPTQVTILETEIHTVNTSTSASNYSWVFSDGHTSSQTDLVYELPENPGTYTITMYAINGPCIDSAFASVEVLDELVFYAPNTFTPDGDEFNNTFRPIFNESYDTQSYTLFIFDRWGEIVFESHDLNVGWDGTYHEKMCKEGMYIWRIEIKQKSKDRHFNYTGHINLIR